MKYPSIMTRVEILEVWVVSAIFVNGSLVASMKQTTCSFSHQKHWIGGVSRKNSSFVFCDLDIDFLAPLLELT